MHARYWFQMPRDLLALLFAKDRPHSQRQRGAGLKLENLEDRITPSTFSVVTAVETSDHDNDGTAEDVTTTVDTFDNHGTQVGSVKLYDYGGDGVIDATDQFEQTLDPHGNVTASLTVHDTNGDGNPEWVDGFTQSFDSHNRLRSYTSVDGVYSFTQTYDSHGNTTSSINSYDLDLDGTPDFVYGYV